MNESPGAGPDPAAKSPEDSAGRLRLPASRLPSLAPSSIVGGVPGTVPATIPWQIPTGLARAAARPATAAVLALALLAAGASGAAAREPAGDLAAVAEGAMASVVNISSTRVVLREGPHGGAPTPFLEDPFFRHFFQVPPGQSIPQERRARSLGSGVIVDAAGVVLTNNHVVEGADEIRVTLSDKRELDAELVGADPQSDLAVLRIKGKPEGLRALAFGDSSSLRLTDTVLAIGNPFGVGQTVTMGIVSATGRTNLGIADYEDFIQTDAAINPGNSGGALLNDRGELVGINTAIVSRSGGYQGIGFAIPSNMARGIMTSLLEDGKVERGWLGVSIQDLDRDLAEALGIGEARGVLVADVVPDAPATKAGIRRGDVILSIAGRDVNSASELRNAVAANRAGSSVAVVLVRDKERLQVDVELGALEPRASAGRPARLGGEGLLGGVAVADLDKESRERFRIPDSVTGGAVVTGVEPGSPVARAGVGPGDVILQVDRRPVSGAGDFGKAAAKAGGDSVLLLVAREAGTVFVLVKK